MTRYAVELQPGCWLAPWSGDPGRTCVIDTAATWAGKVTADRKLKEARLMREFPEARVIVVKVSLTEVTP